MRHRFHEILNMRKGSINGSMSGFQQQTYRWHRGFHEILIMKKSLLSSWIDQWTKYCKMGRNFLYLSVGPFLRAMPQGQPAGPSSSDPASRSFLLRSSQQVGVTVLPPVMRWKLSLFAFPTQWNLAASRRLSQVPASTVENGNMTLRWDYD